MEEGERGGRGVVRERGWEGERGWVKMKGWNCERVKEFLWFYF